MDFNKLNVTIELAVDQTPAGMNSYETSNDGDGDGSAAFAAALQFIDDWDVMDELSMEVNGMATDVNAGRASPPVSSGSDDPSVAGTGPRGEASAATGNTQRRGRRRPVEELRELRREEFELSTSLEALRLDARRRLVSVQKAGGLSNAGAQAGFWQRAAARQYEYRKCAEGENARLRVLVQAQIRKAKYLRQVFLKRMKLEVSRRGCGLALCVRPEIVCTNRSLRLVITGPELVGR